jgi:hypothetical protein
MDIKVDRHLGSPWLSRPFYTPSILCTYAAVNMQLYPLRQVTDRESTAIPQLSLVAGQRTRSFSTGYLYRETVYSIISITCPIGTVTNDARNDDWRIACHTRFSR